MKTGVQDNTERKNKKTALTKCSIMLDFIVPRTMGKTKFFPYKEVSILLPVHNGVRQVPTMQPSLVLHKESCNLETSASA